MIPTQDKYYQAENILREGISEKVEELKAQGKKIGLCSGSFDLLHPGHITHLVSASKLCDILIVAVATDKWSEEKKSTIGRPIFSEQPRAYSVAQLKPVDFVIFNHNEDLTLEIIKPDVYIKGPDYSLRKDPELERIARLVESKKGRVDFTRDEKLSTAQVITYIKQEIK